jgi:hypothetical protein
MVIGVAIGFHHVRNINDLDVIRARQNRRDRSRVCKVVADCRWQYGHMVGYEAMADSIMV